MLPIVSRSAAFSRPTTVQGSVRAPVPYQGSMSANDLLDLYVGNTHYRKINRYMRSPDHRTGVNEILDEMMTRDGLEYTPQLRQEADQAVASIPHLEKALEQQPRTQEPKEKLNYPETAKLWLIDPEVNTYIDPLEDSKDFLGFEQQMYQNLKGQGKSVWSDASDYDVMIPSDEAIAFAQSVINGSQQITPPQQKSVNALYRGLHFKDPKEYQSFLTQNKPGAVVEYPAFTSTTSNTYIQQGFANNRSSEHPVLMEIQSPTEGRWVNNKIESEYLYPSNSRFEIVGSESIPGNMPGTKLIARETTAPTAVQGRTADILDRLKGKAQFMQAPSPEVSAAPEPVRQPRKLRSAYAHLMTSNPTQPMPVDYVSYDGGERYAMQSGLAAL